MGILDGLLLLGFSTFIGRKIYMYRNNYDLLVSDVSSVIYHLGLGYGIIALNSILYRIIMMIIC